MFKKTAVFLIFFYILVFPQIIAADLWFKYPSNPIIPDRVDKKELILGARAPTVLKDGNIIKMWFINYSNSKGGLDYIISEDGINWKKPYEKLLFVPDNNETDFSSPIILKENGVYKLWYSVKDNNNKYVIKYTFSNDGITWNNNSQIVLMPGNLWEQNGVVSPYVIHKGNQYYMWYTGWGNNGIFKIGLATSLNGVEWNKNNEPIFLEDNIAHVDNHNLKLINGVFHLWYLTGDGYNEKIYRYISSNGIEWNCPDNNCLILEKNGMDFPKQKFNDSDTLILNNNIYLYLSGIDNGIWKIGLFSEKPIKNSIIIIPGLFASWNRDALLHNTNVNYDQWYLPSYVHEYDGLMKTLENLGYQKDKDYFIFAYDWRKPLESITEDLNAFINSKNFTEKINLVGHSLGGLVSRIYAQKFGAEKISKIITVGSPHQGAIQVYKPLSAGEIDRENTFFWLALKLILVLNKSSLESDKITIQKRFPVVFDLLPIFPFLKNEQGELIATDSMSIKNKTLAKYNFLFPIIYPLFTAIYGESTQSTPEFYYVKPPDLVDQLLGNYQDGKPISTVLGKGDGTVLAKSAFEVNDEAVNFDNFNHGEIIYKKQGIEQILKLLNLDYQSSQVVEGKGTKISPSLIFLIRSPATIEVVDESGNHYYEEDGIIFIENAQSGNYQLLVKGKEQGKYQVVIGQIAENNDVWEYIDGEITDSTPTNQVDQYLINFNNQTAQPNFPTFTPSPSPTPSPTTTTTLTSSSSSSSTGTNISSSSTLTPTPVFLAIRSGASDQTAPLSFPNADIKKTPANQGQVLGEKSKAKDTNKLSSVFIYLLPIIISVGGYLMRKKFLIK
jgi:pimeloyl-ACP methyl ester carboxylesterase/predicted GH43/DUF377 family glycosyl hydrolase